jgi:glycerol uptake facilitator-like aquaporin
MRLMGALLAALAVFLRSVWRAARQLFHEATGAFFILFALIGAVSAWREWQRGSAAWLIALSLGFTLMMGAFAVASFRSARRVR